MSLSLTCRIKSIVGLLGLLGLLVSACSESGDEAGRLKQLSQSCSINSDCADDLVCAFGRCHEECVAARDCDEPTLCVQSGESDLLVCQLDDDVECTDDDECSADQVCAVGGRCRDLCDSNDDCVDGQVCASNEQVCANESEVDDDGALVGSGTAEEASVSGDDDDTDDDMADTDDDSAESPDNTLSAPGITVSIPDDAADEPDDIAVGGEESDAPALPSSWTALSEIFSVRPLGTELARPITLELEYSGDADQLGVAMARDADDDWALLDDPDFDDGIARVATGYLGYFVVVGMSDDGQGTTETDAGGGSTDDSDPMDGPDSGTSITPGDLLPDNSPCETDDDCENKICNFVCQAPTCSDSVQNGSETGVDCGGSCLGGCDNGDPCADASDCASANCVQGICAPLICPGEEGVAQMVPLAAGYCIDSTEVTQSQYAAWLSRGPAVADQEERCEWNTEFAPDAACQNSSCDMASCPDHPQACVDFCDAVAYCAAVGKRLCGSVDGPDVAFEVDSIQSQWFNACSAGGTNTYQYGNEFDGAACSDPTYVNSAVGSIDTCTSSQPGFEGIFDMSGNVAEWVDKCDEATGQCYTQGAQYNTSSEHCSHAFGMVPETQAAFVGFRCCSH